jgi:hypothetical protein
LLDRAISGLARIREAGQPVPDWTLGGGTALMIHARHRISKDIDAFVDDAQYLPFLSPRHDRVRLNRCPHSASSRPKSRDPYAVPAVGQFEI